MSDDRSSIETSRRQLLKTLAGTSAAIPLRSALTAVPPAAAVAVTIGSTAASAQEASAPPAGYQYFGIEEAAFVEAMVDTMCPADDLTPAGTACGLATYFDRQLAGGFGNGERLYTDGPWQAGKPQQGYQLPFDPKSFFSAGVVAAEAACQHANGKRFEALAVADRDAFLQALAEGKVTDERVPLGQWFNELVVPLFEQACFADPIYGGNRGKVFWKMVGYPGLPAFHTLDVTQYRGKPFPAAKQPKSIQDFS
jgi:gluconate 2-dehydrogenase gamma chain